MIEMLSFFTNTTYPYDVNISFAFEAYLKAIMIKQSSLSGFKTGYDLLSLFNSLDAKDQSTLDGDFRTRYLSKTLKDFLDEKKQY